MKSINLVAPVLGMLAKCATALNVWHMQQHRALQNQNGEKISRTAELFAESFVFERVFESIVALKDDEAMVEFVKRLLASKDKFVARGQEVELAGFVQYFDGTIAVQSFQEMQKELSTKSWVKDLKAIDGASLSEADYQAVAEYHNDTAMSLFARAVLRGGNRFIPQEEQQQLADFTPWYSGTKATRSLAQMRSELFSKPWVKTVDAVDIATAAAESNWTEDSTSVKMADAAAVMEQAVADAEAKGDDVADADDKEDHVAVAQCLACTVWGDAHVVSFNAWRGRTKAHPKKATSFIRKSTEDQLTVFQPGTYWLVNGSEMQIQARYWKSDKAKSGLGLGAIAIGGPMVGNNSLVIRALSGRLMWNEQEILHQVPSSFFNDYVQANYIADVEPVAGDSHSPGINFKFANGVRLTVVRYRKQLSARISLCDSDAWDAPLGGQCGNLEETPSRKAHVWLAMQSAVSRLPKKSFIFPARQDRS